MTTLIMAEEEPGMAVNNFVAGRKPESCPNVPSPQS